MQIATIHIKVKPNSFIAQIAHLVLGGRGATAITIGKTIYIYGCNIEDFVNNKRWVRHEFVHILQYRRFGTLNFTLRYLLESFRNGYYKNIYEVEARKKELLTLSEQNFQLIINQNVFFLD